MILVDYVDFLRNVLETNSRKYRPNRLVNIRPRIFVFRKIVTPNYTLNLKVSTPKHACEQIDFFASGFKCTTKYQNALRFNFNLFNNLIKLELTENI